MKKKSFSNLSVYIFGPSVLTLQIKGNTDSSNTVRAKQTGGKNKQKTAMCPLPVSMLAQSAMMRSVE